MRRSDRLFQIVNFMQGRRVAVTAQDIAEEFDVSIRTVYRDVQDLILTGVPISGEAGVGYLLDKSYCLPPMQLDVSELEALMLGAEMVSSWSDETMAKSARSLVNKLKSVLPERDREIFSGTAMYAPPSRIKIPWTIDFSELRKAIRAKDILRLEYEDESGNASERTVRPLALTFWGPTWLLLAWCELRNDYRHFRLDRMKTAEKTGEPFKDTPETSLKNWLRMYQHKEKLRD
ncbi:YafY family transcriptional regulator [Kordiimonas sp. SCSIO 12603]|uniref:helix-turn-helix transcriptional regulator n=1 Tax=Kordiimonas sp. SCSIO 12603 TaxID=2829596 RepID=UPI002103C717|nr:YafY family protein [Kordiimonas sp. SCSIO 12603]UTW59569.1 YafY family transcriptional regulator [Kordiimonas sp. SCSIO 12603]